MKRLFLIVFALVLGALMFAQTTFLSSYGGCDGDDGALCYSIGQCFGCGVAESDCMMVGEQLPFESLRESYVTHLLTKIDSVEVYPNPCCDFVSISHSLKGEVECRLYDAVGKCLKVQCDEYKFNLSSYMSGVYFIFLKSEGGFVMKKIIKK